MFTSSCLCVAGQVTHTHTPGWKQLPVASGDEADEIEERKTGKAEQCLKMLSRPVGMKQILELGDNFCLAHCHLIHC